MCLICIELQKKTLTIPEANRNLAEMQASLGEVHTKEVKELIHKIALDDLQEMLKDFDPFVSSPPVAQDALYIDDEPLSLVEMSDLDYFRMKMSKALALPGDEPMELEFEDDIPTTSW